MKSAKVIIIRSIDSQKGYAELYKDPNIDETTERDPVLLDRHIFVRASTTDQHSHYPDVAKVFNDKKPEPVAWIGINIEYLSLCAKIFSEGSRWPSVKMELFGTKDAIRLSAEGEFPGAELLVMPLRV